MLLKNNVSPAAAVGLVSLLAATANAGRQRAAASATLLYAASYSGTVTTLNLTRAANATGQLEVLSSTDGCAGSPSWLTLDAARSVLYCTDEGLTSWPDGSLSSFRTNDDGSLDALDKVTTLLGPVSAVVYGQDSNGLAVAHYGGSGFTAWNVSDASALSAIQADNYTLSEPGPNPERQDAPHPHQAILDPTGRFILLPDLGADLIRIYATSSAEGGLALDEREPLAVAPGSGPRHVAFAVKGGRTFMYLVTELANTIVGYSVTYDDENIAFEETWSIDTHGQGNVVPEGAAAAEILVSPDTNFLIVSSRNESALEIPNFDKSNSTAIVSDPLINFAIDAETGALERLQEVPCGGRFPRHFSISKDGSLVATAMQTDGRVAIIERDVKTGQLGEFIASVELEGEITAVIFKE